VAGTLTGGVAALQRIPVVRARVTVTDLETAESMTGTEAARLDWCAAVTTVRSSELITTRRMTAARDLQVDLDDIQLSPQTGLPGQPGGVLPQELSGGNRNARRNSAPLITAGWESSTFRRDTLTPTVCDNVYSAILLWLNNYRCSFTTK